MFDNLRTETAGSFGTMVHTIMHSITYKKTAIFKAVASILMQIFIKKKSLKRIRFTETYKCLMIKDP